MSHSIEPKSDMPSPRLQIWYCENCRVGHFKTGNVMLDFTRAEFKDLTRVLMEIYQRELGEMEFYRLLNSLTQDDDILQSQLVV